jgi:hypothetical protein
MCHKFCVIKEVSNEFRTVYIAGQENSFGDIAGL